jgi:predicted transporter
MKLFWRYLLIYFAINMFALGLLIILPSFFANHSNLGWGIVTGLLYIIVVLYQMGRSYAYMHDPKKRIHGQGWATALLSSMLIGYGVCTQLN